MSMPPVTVSHLMIGRALPFGPNGEPSAIAKHGVAGPLQLTVTGFVNDEQGDTSRHGGADKALHHYPAEHYAQWRLDLAAVPPEHFRSGAFGENLSTFGLTEASVCIGDIFRLGSAIIQVSQARQPCWKLNVRFGRADMARLVQQSARTGWYYRVLETGEVTHGAALQLLERPHPEWPLARLLHHLYTDTLNSSALLAIAALDVLPASWKKLAQQRLESGQIEDWSHRLNTPVVASDGDKPY